MTPVLATPEETQKAAQNTTLPPHTLLAAPLAHELHEAEKAPSAQGAVGGQIPSGLKTFFEPKALVQEQQLPKETVFNRKEKKYLISTAAAKILVQKLGADLVQDKRGTTVIRNLYLDTETFSLIRRSMKKPLYKEKLRIRTYGTVEGPQHEAFVEVKKKLDGVVYKRRLALSLLEAEQFVQGNLHPQGQIARELAWAIQSYSPLMPAITVNYCRSAYSYPGLDGKVRITIDRDLKAKPAGRCDFYLPEDSPAFESLLPHDQCIMEIKVLGAIPVELTHLLSSLSIYPQSFSKVGTAYQQLLAQESATL